LEITLDPEGKLELTDSLDSFRLPELKYDCLSAKNRTSIIGFGLLICISNWQAEKNRHHLQLVYWSANHCSCWSCH